MSLSFFFLGTELVRRTIIRILDYYRSRVFIKITLQGVKYVFYYKRSVKPGSRF